MNQSYIVKLDILDSIEKIEIYALRGKDAFIVHQCFGIDLPGLPLSLHTRHISCGSFVSLCAPSAVVWNVSSIPTTPTPG